MVGSALLVVLASACSHAETEPSPAFESRVSADSGDIAPVGQKAVVQLSRSLGTDVSYAGDLFTARLAAPLLGANGGVLLREGAVVQGSVASITVRPPSLTLRFDSVHTANGDAPLNAIVVAVNGDEFGVKEASSLANEGRFSTLMRRTDIGTLPTPVDTAPSDVSREELRIPVNTTLELMLTSPLIVRRQ
jgi:hypothetical protein